MTGELTVIVILSWVYLIGSPTTIPLPGPQVLAISEAFNGVVKRPPVTVTVCAFEAKTFKDKIQIIAVFLKKIDFFHKIEY